MSVSSDTDVFEGSVPKDLLTHLDFMSSMMIIVLSFVFRKLGLLKDEHVPGLRAATFSFALPALNLSLLWKAELSPEIAIVLIISLVLSTCTAGIAMGLAQLARTINQGFYAMALCANAIPFVYPALLGSSRFNEETITACVMLELGGNIWMANIYYAVAGKLFAPSHKKLDDGKMQSSSSAKSLETEPSVPPFTQFGVSMNEQRAPDDSGSSSSGHIAESESTSNGTPAGEQSRSKQPRVVALLTRNVLLWAIFVGLILNVTGAPYYIIPGKCLQMLSAMFGPLLYAIIGAELQFDLGLESYGVVLRVILSRWLCNAIGIAIVRLVPWGLSPPIRGALTLCMLTPLPSTFIMYTGLYGYRRDQAAVMYSISAVASLAAISLLAPFV